MRLAQKWLEWFRSEGYGTPGVCRLDFLAALPPGSDQALLWTVELGECGSSMCGLPHEARSAAALNEAVADAGADRAGRFPQVLPSLALPAASGPDRRQSEAAYGRRGRGDAHRYALER